MQVLCLPVGMLQANCYIVYEQEGGEAVVIDPGAEEERILRRIGEHGLRVRHVLLTHVHFDHMLASREVMEATGADLLVPAGDAQALNDNQLNARFLVGPDTPYPLTASRLLNEGDLVAVGGMRFHVLETPGHTAGGCCYICEDALFTGDTLFAGSVGRTDLPGGSAALLMKSLGKLSALPGAYTVYPGHGEATTLEREKQSNPFMGDNFYDL